jgi:hypothetical protein
VESINPSTDNLGDLGGDGDLSRMGIYILKLTAKDQSGSKTWENVQTIVLAKKL